MDSDYHPRERIVYDGKRMRKPVQRRTVDYNSTVVKWLEDRVHQRDYRDLCALQFHSRYIPELLPSIAYRHRPISSICTKHIHTSINKQKCPINTIEWFPQAHRLITGASSGEFTLWNGLTFNFETILQAHEHSIRAMTWSHDSNWMISGDQGGRIKYWQPNMNNVKEFQGHTQSIRDISFAPTDLKFVSCADDSSAVIWDFEKATSDIHLKGHGWDVKCCEWHPQRGLVATGSKDNLVKLWDPRTGDNVSTLHGHKNAITRVRFNQNGNWLLTCSRDQMVKMFDIRKMQTIKTFKGHNREVTALAWHPQHEELFVSGSFTGSILFWLVRMDVHQSEIATAHDGAVWDLAWHPLGHLLASGSNDNTTKFWCRNRPGDLADDTHILFNQQPPPEPEMPSAPVSERAPGFGLGAPTAIPGVSSSSSSSMFPGLGGN
eukprot:GILJ01006869.1.p1 GENE.GILJ01006869.1~~GILJ01006869.1.p1  ORF type:complete len:434 (+),score=42.77 GILJ01006869.1:72-1373(+)